MPKFYLKDSTLQKWTYVLLLICYGNFFDRIDKEGLRKCNDNLDVISVFRSKIRRMNSQIKCRFSDGCYPYFVQFLPLKIFQLFLAKIV